jgi:hypothetical protein
MRPSPSPASAQGVVGRAYERAKDILRAHRDPLMAIAQTLLDETRERAEFEALLEATTAGVTIETPARWAPDQPQVSVRADVLASSAERAWSQRRS